jgi:hypothetical protein
LSSEQVKLIWTKKDFFEFLILPTDVFKKVVVLNPRRGTEQGFQETFIYK